mmetsp:Transcript_1184/g.1897  ORF Transcript_1184/g.1897 Transcript_1184/m.1897 type:complete len:189 (+) Transcript_1184:640-1206(+)
MDNLEIEEYSSLAGKRRWHLEVANTHWFCQLKSGTPLFVLGPDYWAFAVSYVLVGTVIGLMLTLEFELPLYFLRLGKLSKLVYFVAMVCWFLMGVLNPGLELKVPSEEEACRYFNSKKFCRVCEVLRETGTLHCVDCDICVRGKTKHVIWIGKCLGRNIKVFYYIFLFCAGWLLLYLTILTAAAVITN